MGAGRALKRIVTISTAINHGYYPNYLQVIWGVGERRNIPVWNSMHLGKGSYISQMHAPSRGGKEPQQQTLAAQQAAPSQVRAGKSLNELEMFL